MLLSLECSISKFISHPKNGHMNLKANFCTDYSFFQHQFINISLGKLNIHFKHRPINFKFSMEQDEIDNSPINYNRVCTTYNLFDQFKCVNAPRHISRDRFPGLATKLTLTNINWINTLKFDHLPLNPIFNKVLW